MATFKCLFCRETFHSKRAQTWHYKKNPKCATAELPEVEDDALQEGPIAAIRQEPSTHHHDSCDFGGPPDSDSDSLTDCLGGDFLGHLLRESFNNLDLNAGDIVTPNLDGKIVLAEDEESLNDNEDDDASSSRSASEELEEDGAERMPPAWNKYQFNATKLKDWGPGYLKTRIGDEPGMQGYHCEKPDQMQSDEKSDIELLHILQGYDLSLFKKVREWRHNSHFLYGHQMDPSSYKKTTRDKAIKDLGEKYGLENLRPRILSVTTPSLGLELELVVFPFGESFVSLLTSPSGTDPDNLLVDQNDPFKPPIIGGEDGFLGDVNTGAVHVAAHKEFCTGPNDLLSELFLFVDKSFVDLKGKCTLEPVMYTTGLYNREFRNQPEAWRPMGYLPNLDHLAPRADAKKKLNDYHFCLKIILSEMIEYQKLGGIEWTMMLDGRMQEVRLQIPLSFIIGDTEGHDKLAGRKIDRVTMSNKQCRYCDVDHHDCSNPFVKTKLTMRADIRRLRLENTPQSLKTLEQELSYRQIDDAFDEVVFSDQARGIHGAEPAEVLHAVSLGIEERMIGSLFSMKRKKGTKRKVAAKKGKRKAKGPVQPRPRKRAKVSQKAASSGAAEASDSDRHADDNIHGSDCYDDDDEEYGNDRDPQDSGGEECSVVEGPEREIVEEVYIPVEEQFQSPRGMFGAKTCDGIDAQCRKLHKQLRWQSDKDLPRTNFPTGISSLSKMSGNERAGVLLLLSVVLCIDNTHYGMRKAKSVRKVKQKETGYLIEVMGPELARNVIKNISLLLTFEGFLKSGKVPLDCIPVVKAFVPIMMEAIMKVFVRKAGTGHNTIKTHQVISHMIDDVYRFASGENYNSGPLESSHIQNIKQPGRNTQKRSSTFAVQCSQHYCSNLIIKRAWADHPNWKARQKEPDANTMEISRAWLTITAEKVFAGEPTENGDKNRKNIEEELDMWEDSSLRSPDLIQIVRRKILPRLKNNHVTIHRTMTKGGKRFQANPYYGRERLARQHWAVVEVRSKKRGGGHKVREIPMHLQCILCIDETPDGVIQLDLGSKVKEKGYYVLAHTVGRELSETGNIEEWGPAWNHGTLAEVNQKLVHMATKKKVECDVAAPGGRVETKERCAVCLFPVGAVKDGMIGVLDPNHDQTSEDYYFFIASNQKWASLFIDSARHEMSGQALEPMEHEVGGGESESDD